MNKLLWDPLELGASADGDEDKDGGEVGVPIPKGPWMAWKQSCVLQFREWSGRWVVMAEAELARGPEPAEDPPEDPIWQSERIPYQGFKPEAPPTWRIDWRIRMSVGGIWDPWQREDDTVLFDYEEAVARARTFIEGQQPATGRLQVRLTRISEHFETVMEA